MKTDEISHILTDNAAQQLADILIDVAGRELKKEENYQQLVKSSGAKPVPAPIVSMVPTLPTIPTT